jgi:hypothetical protein
MFHLDVLLLALLYHIVPYIYPAGYMYVYVHYHGTGYAYISKYLLVYMLKYPLAYIHVEVAMAIGKLGRDDTFRCTARTCVPYVTAVPHIRTLPVKM